MATVGTNAAVVQLPNGFTMTGPVAWLLWVFVHITSLLGNGNRLSTLTHFFVRYLWALRKRAIPIVGDVRPVRPNGDRAPEKWQTEKTE
jgi:NADH dehydrogenase